MKPLVRVVLVALTAILIAFALPAFAGSDQSSASPPPATRAEILSVLRQRGVLTRNTRVLYVEPLVGLKLPDGRAENYSVNNWGYLDGKSNIENAHALERLGIMNMQKSNQPGSKAIALVHGGFVDGSGWAGVYNILKEKGYNVVVVQNPTKSLAEDVAFTKSAIDSLKSEVVLVGHSYGGVVITEAGTHPRVTDLVYIAAFAPDKGESVSSLIANPPPGAPVPPILPPQDGYLFLDRGKFAASFAADVEREMASFMADSQVPWGVDALTGAVSEPAWKTKPSYYLVASDDKMIPPPAQRKMAERVKARVTEVAGSHAVYVSKPREVAAIIDKAAASSN